MSSAQTPIQTADRTVPATNPIDATRRRLLALAATAGLGQTLFPGALLALAQAATGATPATGTPTPMPATPKITAEMIDHAGGDRRRRHSG